MAGGHKTVRRKPHAHACESRHLDFVFRSVGVMPHGAIRAGAGKNQNQCRDASLGLPYLPLIIAQQRKYFAEEGLEVEIAAFAGGSRRCSR